MEIDKIDQDGNRDGKIAEAEFLEFMAQQLLNARNMKAEMEMAFESAFPGVGHACMQTHGKGTSALD